MLAQTDVVRRDLEIFVISHDLEAAFDRELEWRHEVDRVVRG